MWGAGHGTGSPLPSEQPMGSFSVIGTPLPPSISKETTFQEEAPNSTSKSWAPSPLSSSKLLLTVPVHRIVTDRLQQPADLLRSNRGSRAPLSPEVVLDTRAGNGFLLGLKTCGLARLQLGHSVTGLRFQVGISCTEGNGWGNSPSWLLSSWRMAKGRESLELLSWCWCLKNNDINTAQKSACGFPDGDQTRNTVLTYPSAYTLPSSITSETKQLPQMAPWNINHKGPSF